MSNNNNSNQTNQFQNPTGSIFGNKSQNPQANQLFGNKSNKVQLTESSFGFPTTTPKSFLADIQNKNSQPTVQGTNPSNQQGQISIFSKPAQNQQQGLNFNQNSQQNSQQSNPPFFGGNQTQNLGQQNKPQTNGPGIFSKTTTQQTPMFAGQTQSANQQTPGIFGNQQNSKPITPVPGENKPTQSKPVVTQNPLGNITQQGSNQQGTIGTNVQSQGINMNENATQLTQPPQSGGVFGNNNAGQTNPFFGNQQNTVVNSGTNSLNQNLASTTAPPVSNLFNNTGLKLPKANTTITGGTLGNQSTGQNPTTTQNQGANQGANTAVTTNLIVGNPQGSNPQGSNPQGSNPQGSNPQVSNPQVSNPQRLNPQGSNQQHNQVPQSNQIPNQPERSPAQVQLDKMATKTVRQFISYFKTQMQEVYSQLKQSSNSLIRYQSDRQQNIKIFKNFQSIQPQVKDNNDLCNQILTGLQIQQSNIQKDLNSILREVEGQRTDHPLAISMKEYSKLTKEVLELQAQTQDEGNDAVNHPSHQQLLLLYKTLDKIENDVDNMNQVVQICFGINGRNVNGQRDFFRARDY